MSRIHRIGNDPSPYSPVIAVGIATIWAMGLGLSSARAELVIEAEQAALRTEGGAAGSGEWNLWSNGRVGDYLAIHQAGTYQITVRARGTPAAGEWPRMALLVSGTARQTLIVDRAEQADYVFRVELAAGPCELAVAFLNDAVRGSEDRNLILDRITISAPPGVPDPARADRGAMAELLERREQETLEMARRKIEENRKSPAVVEVVDAQGRPVEGAALRVEQVQHAFLFGCNIYRFDRYPDAARNAAYKRRFEELFNYATVGFYWRWYEPVRGKPMYDYTDSVVAWCRQRGIRMKGHPLLWGHQAGVPVWSQGQPAPDIQRRRVAEIMQRYDGKIEFWEVVNEPSHIREPKIDEPYRWARQADADAYLIVNDYHVMADGYPPFHALLKQAIGNGVPFDGIGIQAHEPRTMRFPLDRCWEILDHYAALGKELHITEFTPASGGRPITGSHRQGVWDEAAQAEYAVKFYTVCFAHPAVRAITWWDLCDDGAWLPGGGMLRKDMSPKPVYEQLKHLIHHQWTTRLDLHTDAAGKAGVRGFHGTYRLEVQTAEGRVEHRFELVPGKANQWTVRLPGG